MTVDHINDVEQRVTEESLRFLRERGYENPTKVNRFELMSIVARPGSQYVREIDRFSVSGRSFEQAYAIDEKGNCFYSTLHLKGLSFADLSDADMEANVKNA